MKQTHVNIHSVNTLITVVVICLAFVMSFSVIAEEYVAQEYNADTFTLSIDNDGLLGTDKDYTSGIFFKYNSKSTTNINDNSPLLLKSFGNWLPLQQESNKGWGLTVGQKIWTPEDITSTVEEEDVRPYTGFLFVEAKVFEFSAKSTNKYKLMLGVVGPDAFGEKSQTSIHSLIGSDTPQGWERQITSQTVFNLSYESQRLLTRTEDKTHDLAFSHRINVGNFKSEIAIGSTLRWGDSLNESFGSVSSMPGNYIDTGVLSKSRKGQFYYVALEGRYRFQDITIDGARPKNLFDVHTQHLQATISTGAVYYEEKWGVALSIITSSPEYKEDLQKYNSTASLELFWRV